MLFGLQNRICQVIHRQKLTNVCSRGISVEVTRNCTLFKARGQANLIKVFDLNNLFGITNKQSAKIQFIQGHWISI